MKLLTVENAKTIKGESLGYLTGILYLAPSNESGVMNVCPMASKGCRAACLFTAGRGRFDSVRDARIRKTIWLHDDRSGFTSELSNDIKCLIKRARKLKLIPAVRINGTSDLPQLALTLATQYPNVQFYDYTKIPRPWERVRKNYSLTFSLSESNAMDALDALRHNVNVAVVFDTKKGQPLPKTWGWAQYKVVDGDRHDLRFLDRHRKAVVIGLRAKGEAKKDHSGFVQIGGAYASTQR